MNKIVVDGELAAQFAANVNRVPIFDADGNELGAFLPKPDARRYDLDPRFSEAELRQLERNDGPWLSTEEVVRRLGTPECSSNG